MAFVVFALISPIIMAAESQFSTALLWDGDEDVSEQRSVLRAGVSSQVEEVSPLKCVVRETAARMTLSYAVNCKRLQISHSTDIFSRMSL